MESKLTKTYYSQYIKQATNLFYISLILGFVYGLAKSVLVINNNNYFYYNLYNLILLKFQQNLNEYLVIFALISILILILSLVTKWIIYSLDFAFPRFKIIEYIQRAILSITNSKKTRTSALVLVSFVIVYNIFIIGYQKINSPEGPNIIVISIDTVRADHLASYGYHRTTTPNIDDLAKQGVVFENAFSQAPWTLPSMASMHTSLYPSEHGAENVYSRLNDHFVTIAEVLKNNFYKTIGIISQSFLSSKHGFSQGYQIFDERYISGVNDISSESITKRAMEYIEENKSDPFFLWIHYFDPHHSYIDHVEFSYGSGYSGSLPDKLDLKDLNENKSSLNQDDIDYVKDIYDEELALTDKNIGDLINNVYDLGLEDNTIIIITADHGEEFLERTRFGHGKNLYQELIHMPLIIYVPTDLKYRGKRVKENVEISSIPYTIIDLLGIEKNLFRGINLLEVNEKQNTVAFSEGSYAWGVDKRKEGIIYKNWKLIKNLDDQTYELYNLENDPSEKMNLIEEQNIIDKDFADNLKKRLSSFKKERATNTTDIVKFNKEDVDRLKALGYIQ